MPGLRESTTNQCGEAAKSGEIARELNRADETAVNVKLLIQGLDERLQPILKKPDARQAARPEEAQSETLLGAKLRAIAEINEASCAELKSLLDRIEL
jgi:hypothetical protein